VVDDDGAFLGSLHTPRLAELAADRPEVPVGRIADAEAMTVPADAALDAAVDAVATSRGGWVPVLDSEMRVVGTVAGSDLVTGWRMAMRHAVHRLGRAARDAVVVEATVEPGAPADGRQVAELALPRGAVVVAVHRGNGLLFPDAGTVLRPGDLVSAFTSSASEEHLRRLLASATPAVEAP
jgi:CBS-domain-containing membrane protein